MTLGWDTRITEGDMVYEVEQQKVFANGEVIFACAGDIRRTNALAHMDVPKIRNTDWDIDRYVNTRLVPAMLDAFDRRTVGDDYPIGACLIVVRGRVYEIGHDGSVTRKTDGVYSLGSGSQFALGAMRAGASVREALDIAAHFDAHTGHTLKVAQSTELLERQAA